MAKRLGRDEMRTLVLHVLLSGPSHGYAIARAVERDSAGALAMGEGTLYPVLRVLEADGAVVGEWETADGGPARKVYRITDAGREERARRVRDWDHHIRAVGAVLGHRGLRHA